MICLLHFLLSPEQQQSLFSINQIGDVYSVVDYSAEISLKTGNNLGYDPGDEQVCLYKRGLAIEMFFIYIAHFPTLVHSERIQNGGENNWISA